MDRQGNATDRKTSSQYSESQTDTMDMGRLGIIFIYFFRVEI